METDYPIEQALYERAESAYRDYRSAPTLEPTIRAILWRSLKSAKLNAGAALEELVGIDRSRADALAKLKYATLEIEALLAELGISQKAEAA